MEIIEAINNRRSVRSYKPENIPDEILFKLLDAARLAPSAMNYQPWKFIIIKLPEKKKRIARSGLFGRFMSQAPIIIVACGDKRSKYHIHDTCIALEHMVLSATGEGLGTCWIVSYDEQTVKEELNIPERYRVVAILSIGYPKEEEDLVGSFLHFLRPKKTLDQIVYWEEFGKT
jgi:nitroreductase